MRIYEIITESFNITPSPVILRDELGGGSVSITGDLDKGKLLAVYKNKSGEVEAKAMVESTRKFWSTKQRPDEEWSKISNIELMKMFDRYVTMSMMSHLGDHINSQDPDGTRIIDLSRKINMKENTNTERNKLALIKATLKPVMDYGYSLAAKLDEKERLLREESKKSKQVSSKK